MRYTNRLNLPDPWFRAAQMDEREWEPNHISVTTLIKPPQMVYLERKHWDNIEVDVSKQTWAIFGRMVHEVLSRDPEPGARHELDLEMEINGWTVTGRLDRYVAYVIEDWKTTSVWHYLLGGKEEWEKQLNCYAYLLRHQERVVARRLEAIRIFRDWRRGESRQREDYPAEGPNRIDIPLWGYADQKDFIEIGVLAHQRAARTGEYPPCTSKERWVRDEKWSVVDPAAKPKNSGWRSPKRHPSLGFGSGLHNSEESAQEHIEAVWEDKAKTLAIEHRPGESTRCEGGYCKASPWCRQWAAIRQSQADMQQ